MSEAVFDLLVNLAVMLIGAGISAIFSMTKNIKDKKTREGAEKIARAVERVYKDCTSTEKLEAFKQLCKDEKLDVSAAVKYLEDVIIPMSKQINVVPNRDDQPTKNGGFD